MTGPIRVFRVLKSTRFACTTNYDGTWTVNWEKRLDVEKDRWDGKLFIEGDIIAAHTTIERPRPAVFVGIGRSVVKGNAPTDDALFRLLADGFIKELLDSML